MTDYLSPKQFHESEGVADWRLTSEGATAFFRTGSFAESARFVQAISELPGNRGASPRPRCAAGGRDRSHDHICRRLLRTQPA